MFKPHEIDACSEDQRNIVIKLCRETFLLALGEEGAVKNTEQFQEQLTRNHVLVASIGSKVAGFAAYDFARDDDYYKNYFLRRQLSYARNRDQQGFLLKQLRELQPEYGREAFIEYFENVFTLTEKIDVHDEDMILTHISVVPDFRRRGIAQALTEARLRIAKTEGAAAAYVDCWEGGPISKLYEKLGFNSIIRAGPSYHDGSAMRLMGLLL